MFDICLALSLRRVSCVKKSDRSSSMHSNVCQLLVLFVRIRTVRARGHVLQRLLEKDDHENSPVRKSWGWFARQTE